MKNTRLFQNLMAQVKNTDGKFFFRDAMSPMGTKTRVFSYHFANHSDWLHKNALECRGILFELDENDKPVRVMSRPMEKFFNLGECPMTMNMDLTKVAYVMDKADGSLISTYEDKGTLQFKSKTSLHSEQAIAAGRWINDHPELKERLMELAKNGFTVNMEYVGRDNRIVLDYKKSKLIILNVRDNARGGYVGIEEIYSDPILRPYMVDVYEYDIDSTTGGEEWIADIRGREQIEGVILVMEDGQKVKLKTDWYVALHRTKDSITNNKALIGVCAENSTDDLRGLFQGDDSAQDKIDAFEKLFFNNLTTWLEMVKVFHAESMHMDRKSYAISAQTKFRNHFHLFHIAMRLFGKSFDGELVVKEISENARKLEDLFTPKGY